MSPHNAQEHPLVKEITMVEAIVSGDSLKIRDFHNRLQTYFSTPGNQGLENSTTWHDENGKFGVLEGIKIPLVSLE